MQRFHEMQSLSFQIATRRRGNEGCFPLSREVRENKQKERNRLLAHVNNVGRSMAKNIE